MTDLEQAIDALPRLHPGPGGACAVLRDGQIIAQHAWGYANAERRIPFTSKTLFRMCSVTKQFTCATLLDAFPDPSALDADVKARLPHLETAPSAAQLCHNQSGLRDYWAVAMLHGAPAESAFGDHEATRLIAAAKSLQFQPGARYSYCNQNFRLLSDILQDRTGQSFADLLRTRIFDRAGMATAFLAAETSAMPDGTQGYEGTQASGFRPAVNNILWTGDAGLGASLDDMIAWERHIDAARDDPRSLYARLSAPVTFADGAPATYGFGLGRHTKFGRAITSHGGALRGWRSHRLHVASDRISVVVLLNHLSRADLAATSLLAALLGETTDTPAPTAPVPAFEGAYLDSETNLAARITQTPAAKLALHYDRHPDELTPQPDGSATTEGIRLHRDETGLRMDRTHENQSSHLRPIEGAPRHDVAGHYHCPELGADLTIADAGNTLYGAFSGFLGQGRMELLDHVAADTWTLPCPRALDHTPPGDWTLSFHRQANQIDAVTIGCWLARNLTYHRR